MNPTNVNPNQDQMPVNPVAPGAQPPVESVTNTSINPAMSGAQQVIDPVMSAPVNPVMPTVQMPVNPEMVVATESVVTTGPEMSTPIMNSTMPETVAPTASAVASETQALADDVFMNPMMQGAAASTSPVMSEMPTPVNPVITPGVTSVETEGIMVGATDPIAMPSLPKAPDPVEEELKAPMTAAAPVPGSIGSAISVPSEQPASATPNNVAFNDPAMAQMAQSASAPAAGKKKKDQKTLIILCLVAGIIVVGLVVVLIMMSQGMI